MMTHPLDDLEAYVVGALPPDEMAALERHLAQCASCRATVANLHESLDLLAFAAPAATAPPDLLAGIMDEIAALPSDEQPGAPPLMASQSRVASIPVVRVANARAAVSASAARPRARGRAWQAALISAAAIICAVVGVRLWLGTPTTSALAQAEARAQAAIPHGRVSVLHPTAAGPVHAIAVVAFDPVTQQGVFEVADMPALSAQQVYECWLQSGTTPTRAGIFTLHSDGTGELRFTAPVHLARLANAGISLETGIGVITPDTPMLMLIHP